MIKNYFLNRTGSLTAWIGVLGFFLEIALHGGRPSSIMLCLFVFLIVLPETHFRDMFGEWSKVLKGERNGK